VTINFARGGLQDAAGSKSSTGGTIVNTKNGLIGVDDDPLKDIPQARQSADFDIVEVTQVVNSLLQQTAWEFATGN